MFHRFHTGTWQRRASGRVPTRFIPVRVARATVTMAVLRICALLLLFDCQEAFHCCLVVACINRINMISIECHRSGERCPGKREFDNRIEINRVRSGEIMWLFPLNKPIIIIELFCFCFMPLLLGTVSLLGHIYIISKGFYSNKYFFHIKIPDWVTMGTCTPSAVPPC